MDVYYQDKNVKLYHGKAQSILPNLTSNFDACVFDPPYGESQNIKNDSTIKEAEQFLETAFEKIHDSLKVGASLSTFWTFRRLPILLDLAKSCGWDYRRILTMYLPNGSARPDMGFLPRTQPICLFNKSGQGRKFGNPEGKSLHDRLASLLQKHVGSKQELANKLAVDPRLIKKWTDPKDPQWCFPGPKYVERLRKIFNLDEEFDEIIKEWRNRNPGKNRKSEYRYNHDCYTVKDRNTSVDWHPTPKPLRVVRHLVHTLVDKEETVLDPACGSGTTLVASKLENRKAVGIETNERYCEKTARRIENSNHDFW